MRPVLALILLAALPIEACASRPAYVRPDVPLGETFRNAGLQSPTSPRVAVVDQWWRAFGDPVLDSLVDEAMTGSLTVEAAAARLQQAAAGVRAARADGLPSVGAEASGAIQRQSLEAGLGQFASRFPGYDRTNRQFGLNLAASWELDLFGRLSAGRRAARANLDAAQADLAGARLTVAAEIAGAYLDARELEARLDIARARIETLRGTDHLVRLRLARGAAARFEVDQTAGELSAAEAALPALEAAREAALNRIDLLAGRAPGFAAAEIGRADIPLAPTIDGELTPASLLLRRPDLVAAERAVAAADARTAQVLASRLPTVTIGALAGFLSGGLSNLFTGPAAQTSASGAISGPLLDFGRTGAGIDRARAQTREAVANYRLAVLRAAGEAENAFAALVRSKQQAEALSRGVGALRQAHSSAQAAYRAGANSLTEVLNAERRLQDAQDGEATARADAARAAVATFRALGGGFRAS